MLKKIISIILLTTILLTSSIHVFAAETEDEYVYIVGEYTIKYSNEESNAIINCKIAAEAIDGTMLEPGEEFSFNDIVGKRTAEKGYKEARVIQNGKYATGIGGGICILSSCIFNAALESNFKITERNPHTLKVNYVPYGRDAMVSWGTSDLKFKNNYYVPIKISINISNKNMKVRLLSKQKINIPNAKVKTRYINGAYYTYRYIGWDINYVTKSVYKN